MTEQHAETVTLTAEQANALREALENYMRVGLDGLPYLRYRDLWNAADIALVPLRGGPYSQANRDALARLSGGDVS